MSFFVSSPILPRCKPIGEFRVSEAPALHLHRRTFFFFIYISFFFFFLFRVHTQKQLQLPIEHSTIASIIQDFQLYDKSFEVMPYNETPT